MSIYINFADLESKTFMGSSVVKTVLENLERSVRGVRMGKSGPLERAELANQIRGFRIPDHWDASEKNKLKYFFFPLFLNVFVFIVADLPREIIRG